MAPNLDAMSYDELLVFVKRHTCGRNSIDLFPECAPQIQVTRKLCLYAAWKADAITSRLAGSIESAKAYEAQCENIYKKLPDWAKW